MDFLPEKRFLLIGDNSQQDVAIYSRIGQAYPERVHGIMIHNVLRRPPEFLAEQQELLNEKGVRLVGFKDYEVAKSLLDFFQNS